MTIEAKIQFLGFNIPYTEGGLATDTTYVRSTRNLADKIASTIGTKMMGDPDPDDEGGKLQVRVVDEGTVEYKRPYESDWRSLTGPAINDQAKSPLRAAGIVYSYEYEY